MGVLVVSERRRAANRANARQSSGPRSTRGKAASARNATTHGLSAARITLDGPERARLSRRLRAWSDDLRPRDELERALVARMARASILVERVGRLDDEAWAEVVARGADAESAAPPAAFPESRALRRVIRHAPRWRRALSLGLAAFHRLRRATPERRDEANARAAQVVQRLDRLFDRRSNAAHAAAASTRRRRAAAPEATDAPADAANVASPGSILQNEANVRVSMSVQPQAVASRPAAAPAHANRTIAVPPEERRLVGPGARAVGVSRPARSGARRMAAAGVGREIAVGAPGGSILPNKPTTTTPRGLERPAVASQDPASSAHANGRGNTAAPATRGRIPTTAGRSSPRTLRRVG